MGVAGPGCCFDTRLIKLAGFLSASERFQSPTCVKVSRRVVGIDFQNRAEFGDRIFGSPQAHQLHRQGVAGERAVWIAGQHLAQRIEPGAHVLHGTLPRVACPYFVPLLRLSEPGTHRLPLGAYWLGECAAGPGESPSEAFQREYCNFGYAEGQCARFPAQAEADAVRFTRRGKERLFILEKNHSPVRFGPLETIAPGSILEKQAQAWNGT